MNIKETIKKTAELSKLRFDESESEKFEKQFTDILGYVSLIDNLNLDNLEPLSQLCETDKCYREDKAEQAISLTDALKNAPKKNENFFKVPKVIDLTD